MCLKLIGKKFGDMERLDGDSDLRRQAQMFAEENGFKDYVYLLQITMPSFPPQQVMISGYPEKWVARYMENCYSKLDPVLRHCTRSTLPVVWDELVPPDGGLGEFWEEARSFGLRTGVTFTIHEQPGIGGVFSLARDVPFDLDNDELAALIGRGHVFATVLHHAAMRIHLPEFLPQVSAAALTGRERECLKWTADGKTAWEVGRILGITERTAVFHINNVSQKLGAVNKVQAIVRAMALNII